VKASFLVLVGSRTHKPVSWFLTSGAVLHLLYFAYFCVCRKLINSAGGVRSGSADKKRRGLQNIEEDVKVDSVPPLTYKAPSFYSSGIARPSVLTDNVIPAEDGGQPQHLVYLENVKRFKHLTN
jgi:hypothetical protein